MEKARVKCSQGMPPALDTRRAQPGQRELSGAGQGVAGAWPREGAGGDLARSGLGSVSETRAHSWWAACFLAQSPGIGP